MEHNDDAPVMDFDECVRWISESAGIDKKIVEKVLDDETEYMIQIGIITIQT